MKILFTGGSSFTGFWICRALAAAGHGVVATLTRQVAAYADLRRRRVDALNACAVLVPGVEFGTPEFIAVLRREGPFDLLCHHGAEVTNYTSADFDAVAALATNTAGLKAALSAHKEFGGSAVLLTGSVFEAGEGAGSRPRRAFNPYGLSKTLTDQAFRYYVPEAGLRLGKFVISNPFGPFEEPRFTAYLIKSWRDAKAASVRTPDYIRDNIPVDLLAGCYRWFAERLHASSETFLGLNPSGYVESQGAFACRFASEMQPRLKLDCAVKLEVQSDFSQPMMRVNTDPARRLVPAWDETAFWDSCADYYRST